MINTIQYVELSSICEFIDYRGKTPEKTSHGIPLITAKIVKDGRIEPYNEFIAESDYEPWMRRGIPKAGDVIITTEAPLGEVAEVPCGKVAFAQRIIVLSPDRDKAVPRYVKYVLKSPSIQNDLQARASGTVVTGIRSSELQKVQIPLPNINRQTQIAKILGTLDDKIELNNQINETLETMAKAIFKEWFIDFGPVKAKAEGKKPFGMDNEIASLFPDTFQDSELGPIPKGWTLSPLSEVSDFQEGPGIMAVDFHETGIPLIRLAGLKNGVSLLEGCNFLDPQKVEIKWNHFRLKEGDILLSTSASLGRVAEVDSLATGAIAYTGIIRFRALENKCKQTFLKHFLISSAFQSQVEAFGVGSVLKHFGPTHLKGMMVLVPSIEIQTAFQKMVLAPDRLIRNGINESFSLSKIRDALLPKLISGEIST